MIPLVDLRAQYAAIKPHIDAAVQRVLDSTAFTLGHEVEQFESAFATYCGVPHAVGVGSGTAALHLALLACGVGPGDEVITTAFSFIATAEAISQSGARPVFIDIDPATYCIDPERLAAAITPRTKAIVPVHLYGRPADMEPICTVAAQQGLTVIEDAAQAHGAQYHGRRAGNLADVAAFSFYPGKNLGAYGDGGMVTTANAGIAERIRQLRDHGSCQKYRHEIVGYCERLDALQAAILDVKLRYLDGWNAQRRTAAQQYQQRLRGLALLPPAEDAAHACVHHLFVVRIADRDRVWQMLTGAGIGAGIHYPVPMHLQPAYAGLGYGGGSFPHAEQAAREVLSLPLYPEITPDQLDEVLHALAGSLRAAGVQIHAPDTQ